jgi:hypothetical protein
MEGEILARVPGERLQCKYSDRSFDILVELQVAAVPGGTLITQIIDISPKTFIGRLMSPLIRLGMRKQTRKAAAPVQRVDASRRFLPQEVSSSWLADRLISESSGAPQ